MRKNLFKDIFIALQGIVTGMLLVMFVCRIYIVPSGSMKPSLLVGDIIAVTKYSYGFSRYSIFFGNYLPSFGRIFSFSTPKRGDVAVFRVVSSNLDYIKRVIGLPGDTIQVKNGHLYINNKMVKRQRIADTHVGSQSIPTYIETLPNGVKHKIWETGGDDNFLTDNTPKYTIPKGHYFMMGDNRDNSQDSRFSEVGYVSLEQFIGPARLVLISFKGAKYWQFWKWFSTIRPHRIVKVI